MRSAARILSVAVLVASSIAGVGAAHPVVAGVPAGPELVSIASGYASSCALASDGSVACWGANFSGGLGTGTMYNSVIPQHVDLDGPASQVTVGETHACALMSDGTVRCWGSNWSGQVGAEALGSAVLEPVAVPGLDHVVSIAAGVAHTCAVREDRTAWCWGSGYIGQLGQPDLGEFVPPTQVPGIANALKVVAGDVSTCLLLATGRVKCFGIFLDADGGYQINDTPLLIPGLENVVGLAAGSDFTCGLLTDGSVRCVGENWTGQLGDGTDVSRGTAAAVLGVDDAVAIAAGSYHACAGMADGTVSCWGRSADGETGQAPSDEWRQLVPKPVDGIDDVTAIDGGFGFTCAVAAGVGMCFGGNWYGQLGDRTVDGHHAPAPISWLPDSQAPVTSEPSFEIRSGTYLSRDRVRVRITVPATDGPDGTGIDHLEVRVSKDGGTTWSETRWRQEVLRKRLSPSIPTIISIRAVDRVGNVGEWFQMEPLTARLEQEMSPSITYTGTWTPKVRSAFSGGSSLTTTTAGDEATITFTGRSFGLVSRKARLAGEFQVFVDGEDAGVVDLHWRYRSFRQVVFARTWATPGEHVIRIVALGTEGRPRIDLDAFVFIE